jgi:hypothetical protein
VRSQKPKSDFPEGCALIKSNVAHTALAVST